MSDIFEEVELLTITYKSSHIIDQCLSKISENSFIKAIFTSRWIFSITFAASATLIDSALYVPAFIIDWYILSIIFKLWWFEPETIFLIFVKLWFLSPGLIRSGL